MVRRRTRLALCLLCAPVLVAADASAMWRSLGVAPGTAQMHRLERLTSGRNVFLDSALIERRHAVLARELGPQAARVVLLRHPLLLTHDLEETLQPKLRTLEALLPGLNISRAVLRAPALLQLSSETTIAPRLKSLEERLGSRSAAIRAISRTPTLLNLRDIEARYERLRVALPGLKEKELAKVVGQRPELLTFNDSSIQAKAEALAELFHVTDASRIIRRDPRLLTYQPTRLAEKVATFEETLPGVDVRKMLASAPSLLSADVDEAIPRKLAQLSNLLPSLDIDRLVAQAPQLLEYDVENSLVPRLAEIRKLFADPPKRSATPGAAAAAAEAALCNQSGEPLELPSGASNVRSLAANKLLRQRGKVARPIKRSTRRASTRETRAAAANVDPFGQVTNTLRGAAQPLSSTAMAPSIIGLLRLAALDVAVVRARMHQLEKLLPEEQVQHMVRRNPGLLRYDVDAALRPRLRHLAQELGEKRALQIVISNPRMLLSSWGVLGRLTYAREMDKSGCVRHPSAVVMAAKAKFYFENAGYGDWLRRRLKSSGKDGPKEANVAALEKAHGQILAESFAKTAKSGLDVAA